MKQRKKVMEIHRDTCIGCGKCANACHQSAIAMVGGKAMVVRESQCDGLGKCLPVCPVDAIHFVEKEVETFACPSTQVQLAHWPVQIKLVPVTAPYFDGAKLLIAADCTAYAYSNFHRDYMTGKITLIGCPKLDEGDYTIKLTEIFAENNIQSVTVARMEVPCCGGLERAVKEAIVKAGKELPCQVVTVTVQGEIYP